MKPAAFTLTTPRDLAGIGQALAAQPGARVMAGGQSLGPMLNLRVAQPKALVRITGVAELCGVAQTATHVYIGAGVTHAAIADARVPDVGQNILPCIAEGIAYRAVRNRGTIGGSICHADPAADWLTTLMALGAEAMTLGAAGPASGRAIALRQFMIGAFRTCLEPGEILRMLRIPKLAPTARFGYFKACRKPGEFAHAMAAVLEDPASGLRRVVIGALGSTPLVFEGEAAAPAAVAGNFRAAAGDFDDIDVHLHLVAVTRAFEKLGR
jgi:aerobic carbon-monoxide dehydrogenase medium subunit